MRLSAVLATATMLAACSGSAPDTNRAGPGTPTSIGAAAIVRAYARDADEADVEFVGHPLVITGDVVQADRVGHILLTTGSSTERLPATTTVGPHPIYAHDLVTLRCDRIDRDRRGPRVSRCAITAIVPARIARGD